MQELEEEIRRIRQMKYHEAYEQGKFDTNMKVWYEVPKLEQQNKRYREAKDKIDALYRYNKSYGYDEGYLDGLDRALSILDEVEEEKNE